MHSVDIEHFKQILLLKRNEILRQIKNVKTIEMEKSPREANGDLSGYSYHMADQGSDSIERDRTFISIQNDSHSLRAIDEALEKIKTGIYGLCEICGEMINTERLKFIPEASLCLACKEKEEGRREENNTERKKFPTHVGSYDLDEMEEFDESFEEG